MEHNSSIQLTWVLSILLNIMLLAQGDTFFSDDLSEFDLSPKFSSHPMLFFADDDVSGLRDLASDSHSDIAWELESATLHIQSHPHLFPPEDNVKFSAEWNEVYGNNLPPLALYFTLSEDTKLLRFITSYMDRMASYKRWQVAALPKDEVPIAHSLVGFATAFDMVQPYLRKDHQRRYVDKIMRVTEEMYKCSLKRHWGYYYLQNHQATNVLALLIGSLVSEIHVQSHNVEIVARWKSRAVVLFERTMTLLRGIPDGSLDEGAGYVGYTLRSLTQYIFLVRRHFGYDHSGHPWLRKHFDYIYLTTLPGLQRTVGIADSPQGWFYGPESQLYFLDTYVLQDGRANWLAQQIKDNKLPFMKENRPDAQRFTTLHTEFLFYDPNIDPHPPPGFDSAEFHHFQDWGVTVHRTGSILYDFTNFFSFKSSKIHGSYINGIANSIDDDTLRGWKAFNPGHEHPDQNSFTLWFEGHPFVSEGLYGPKYPYLDNVLMFRTSDPASYKHIPCTEPWVGQLGSCLKWLEWHGKEEGRSHGEILTAVEKDGKVFVVGDATGAYTETLQLKKWTRSSILVESDLFILVDHVTLKPGSKVSHVSSYFNNFLHSFKATRHKTSGLSGLTLDFGEGYQVFWTTLDNQSPAANITKYSYTSSDKPLLTSNANMTFPIMNGELIVVYVFTSGKLTINQFGLSRKSDSLQVSVTTTSTQKYRISVTNGDVSQPLCAIHDLTSNLVTELEKKFHDTPLSGDVNDVIRQTGEVPDIFRTGGPRDQSVTSASTTEGPVFLVLGAVCIMFMVIYIRRGRKNWLTTYGNGILFLLGFLCAIMISYFLI